MSNKAFYDFINVLKEKNNKDKMNDFLDKFSIEEVLFAFKGNGFGVNAYPGSRSYRDFIQLRPSLIEKASSQIEGRLIDHYETEINIWNKVFNDYYLKDDFNKVTAIPDEKKLYAFLIVFEIYVRALKDIKFNKGRNRDYYGKVELQKKIGGEIWGIEDLSANQFTNTIDYIFQQASKVVQAFIFHGYLFKDEKLICSSSKSEVEWDEINKSMMHFSLIDIRTVIFDAFEEWKFANYKIVQLDEINIEVHPANIMDLINERIEIQRFESSRYSMIGGNNENAFSIHLAPMGFFDKSEESSYSECLEYFSSSDLNYKVNGVKIPKWLRAYAVIRHVNREFIRNNTFPNSSRPDSWLFISTLEDWINKFTKYGIDYESAKIICKKLIFNKNSIDWFDTPFIKIGEKIITVPSYTSHIQDSLALISLAAKENFNLEFKGYCFEDRIISDLNTSGIPAVSIKRKDGNKEYQCDVAFILGRDLFLCECKHTSQSATQRKRYDFYNRKIPEDIEQINRIAEYYSSNIKAILEELNGQRQCEYTIDWKPRHIYKMILYSCKVSGGIIDNSLIITDYTIFTTLLYKRLPTISQGGKVIRQFMPPKANGAYDGKLTTNKLLNYLKNPWQIAFQKEFTKVEDETVPINNINLHIKKAFKTIDDFYDLD